MIQRIDLNTNVNNISNSTNQNKKSSPNFKGNGAWAYVLLGLQECEKHPMINVAVIDLLSAILPRTIIESMTNIFAGFEAFRRESSGLIVNCLIPSWITLGVATLLNKSIMPKNIKMAGCWADSKLIDKISETYEGVKSGDKIKSTLKEMLENVEGYDGNKKLKFKDIPGFNSETYANRLNELIHSNKSDKEIKKEISKLISEITKTTHIHEEIVIDGEKQVKVPTLTNLLENSVKMLKEYDKNSSKISMSEFAKRSKKLVKLKSGLGLAIVLPLAASMQYINRWITGKISGTKGAPIYDDFGKNSEKQQQKTENDKSKNNSLLKQKIKSISAMIGVCLLSMMKKPSLNMFEFKGLFPTMDQARIISTTTFASRMWVADDELELKEATLRDIATFLSLYFLGDYAAKGVATIVEKKKGVKLLNGTDSVENANGKLSKMWHWIKDVRIKSSEEVADATAKNLRYTCQAASIGVSLLLLGLIIPIVTRHHTKTKHAEELQMAQQGLSETDNSKNRDVKI